MKRLGVLSTSFFRSIKIKYKSYLYCHPFVKWFLSFCTMKIYVYFKDMYYFITFFKFLFVLFEY